MDNLILLDRYQVLKAIASGGTAKVYLSKHIKLLNYWAIKKVSKIHPLYQEVLHEANILKDLKHMGIPLIIDVCEDEDDLYIVEEYIEGIPLKTYLQTQQKLSERHIIDLSTQLCEILIYLHSRTPHPIIYQDLKPDNIIIKPSGKLVLVDFGLSRYDVGDMSKGIGTKGYAAPEQYHCGLITPQTDIYSFGKILSFLMSGTPVGDHLFISNRAHNYFKDFSKPLIHIVENCIQEDVGKRFNNIAQIKELLIETNQMNQQILRKNLSKQGPIYIGIQGSQQRIGVTHFAISLGIHLKNRGYKVLIREQTDRIDLTRLLHRRNEGKMAIINGLYFASQEEQREEDFDIIIEDEGTYRCDKEGHYLLADICYMVMGGKEWELDASEEVLSATHGNKHLRYLFNYVDFDYFKKIKENMKGHWCRRIPYNPDPFKTTAISQEFFDMLFVDENLQPKIKKKNFTIFNRKGKNNEK